MMRRSAVLLVIPLLNLGQAAFGAGEGALRDPRAFVFEGVGAFDVAQIQEELTTDVDLQVAAHPRTSQAEFLKVVEENVTSGYRRSGFAQVKVQAKVDKRRGVIIHVDVGARFRYGDVQVKGMDESMARSLVRWLIERTTSLWAVEVPARLADGSQKTVWETPTGRSAAPRDPCWEQGEPANCDESKKARIRERLGEWFREEGYPFAEFDCEIRPDERTWTATLVIAVKRTGRKMSLGEVSVEGASINSAADVVAWLGLRPGRPYHARLAAQVERRLWESGRFLEQSVWPTYPDRDSADDHVNLKIAVVERPKAPTLMEGFSREHRLLLKMRDWISRWSAGDHDEDLVCEFRYRREEERPSAGRQPQETNPNALPLCVQGRIVMAPRGGQVVEIEVTDGEGREIFAETLVLQSDRIIVHSPSTRKYLDLNVVGRSRYLHSRIDLRACRPDENGRTGLVAFGTELRRRTSTEQDPLAFDVSLSPAAMLNALSVTTFESETEDGIVHLQGKDDRVAIERRSGKPVAIRYVARKGLEIDLRVERGAFTKEIERQAALRARSKNVFDEARPWTSAAIFALDEYRRFGERTLSDERKASLAALRKLLTIWKSEPAADLLQFVRSAFGIEPGDFVLPAKEVAWAVPALNGAGDISAMLAGCLLPTWCELVPASGPMRPMGREAIFALVGRPTGPIEMLKQMPKTQEVGPVGHLIAAAALKQSYPLGSKWLAAQGVKRTQATDFRVDYAPLLAGDSWLSRNLLSLGEGLRELEDDEIRALAGLMAEGKTRDQIAVSLLLIKQDRRRPIRQVWPVVLDRLWNSVLKGPVDSSLQALATGQSPPPPKVLREVRLERTPAR